MTDRQEESVLDLLGRNEDSHSPSVYALATLLSPCPFISYKLLRRARRFFFPGALVDLETRLCGSSLVESASDDGFVLEHAIRMRMLLRLRGTMVDGAPLELADLNDIIQDGLVGLPGMIVREAELTWIYVTQDDPLPSAGAVFGDVLDMVARQRHVRLLSWVSGALTRLPTALLQSDGVWTLTQLCAAVGLPYPRVDAPDQAGTSNSLEQVSWLLPRRAIWFHRDGEFIEFGGGGGRRRCAIDVPDTNPLLLWATAGGGGESAVRVNRSSSDPVRLLVGRGPVSIRTGDGTTIELPAFDGPVAPELLALDHSLDRIEGARRTRRNFTGRVIAPPTFIGGLFVEFDNELAPWAWLPRDRAQTWLTEDMVGHTLPGLINFRVDRVERSEQRITVRRVRGQWSIGDLRVGDRVRGVLVAKTVGRLVFWLNQSAGIMQPQFEPLLAITTKASLRLPIAWSLATGNQPLGRSAHNYPMPLGIDMPLIVLGIDSIKRRVTVSFDDESLVLNEWPPPSTAVGREVSATVGEIAEFGFLVDNVAGLPGIRGVVPNTELSWLSRWSRYGKAADHPLKIGDTFTSVVVGHDSRQRLVQLSLKRLRPDPAAAFVRELQIGDSVDGVLLMRRKFGWWVNINPWSVVASVLSRSLSGVEPMPRMRIRGTVGRIDADGGIALSSATVIGL